jgi:hypothetical protein
LAQRAASPTDKDHDTGQDSNLPKSQSASKEHFSLAANRSIARPPQENANPLLLNKTRLDGGGSRLAELIGYFNQRPFNSSFSSLL